MVSGYTTIEQSRKLIELGLDPSTADMCYGSISYDSPGPYCEVVKAHKPDLDFNDLPCWSLTALLELMPDGVQTYKKYNYIRIDITFVHNGIVTASKRVEDKTYIDAAFEMMCWLIEQGHIN